jgi:5-methylcytosine-specific restriction endonuclease McrA
MQLRFSQGAEEQSLSVVVGQWVAAMNRWNIPDWLEQQIIERDRSCVYCGVLFELPEAGLGCRPSWEHIVNDARIVTLENIALCCRSCNSSKGVKLLATWLDSPYCKKRGISRDTVAAIVRKALEIPQLPP